MSSQEPRAEELDDRRLAREMRALDPTDEQLQRMAAAVMERFALQSRSLAGEWLELWRSRPAVNTGLALAAALVLLVLTPLSAAPGLLLKLAGEQPQAGLSLRGPWPSGGAAGLLAGAGEHAQQTAAAAKLTVRLRERR